MLWWVIGLRLGLFLQVFGFQPFTFPMISFFIFVYYFLTFLVQDQYLEPVMEEDLFQINPLDRISFQTASCTTKLLREYTVARPIIILQNILMNFKHLQQLKSINLTCQCVLVDEQVFHLDVAVEDAPFTAYCCSNDNLMHHNSFDSLILHHICMAWAALRPVFIPLVSRTSPAAL